MTSDKLSIKGQFGCRLGTEAFANPESFNVSAALLKRRHACVRRSAGCIRVRILRAFLSKANVAQQVSTGGPSYFAYNSVGGNNNSRYSSSFSA